MSTPDIEAIDHWLPQTQCTQCGYPSCRLYAEALVTGKADINQCPPGGDVTIQGLADLFSVPPRPLDPRFGLHRPRRTAVIAEDLCIGCTLCTQACPVDAIIGAAKQMHAVIDAECTGCDLCVEPCPVDCIDMRAVHPVRHSTHWQWPDYSPEFVQRARERAKNRRQRLARLSAERAARRKNRRLHKRTDHAQIKAEIADAVARVRARRSPNPGPQ